jgi:hypothetical protein
LKIRKKAEEQKVVEPTREIKQKRERGNLSEDSDVEGTRGHAAEITMDSEVGQERQKINREIEGHGRRTENIRSEDDYVKTMQDQSLEQLEVRSLQSEDDSAYILISTLTISL